MLNEEIARYRLYPNVRPENCVLLIVDPQNDFLIDEGHYAKEGVDIKHMQRTVGPIIKLVKFCREMNVPIFASKHVFKDSNIDGGILCKVRPILQGGGLRKFTWGGEIIEELELNKKKEWIIEKCRLSVFFGTNFDTLLRCLDKKTLIVTGVLTNQCVESTIRDAQFRDYEVIELIDCVGNIGGLIRDPVTRELVEITPEEIHKASIRHVSLGLGDALYSDEIIKELSR